jgi:membrane protein YdbS with pleckstrin-like domain
MAQLHFQPGEVVISDVRPSPLVMLGNEVVTLGLYELWRRRTHLILTNQRVITSKGVVGRSVRSLPLDRIQDASVTNRLWEARIVLSSAGGRVGIEALNGLRTRVARAFLAELTPRIGHAALGGLSGTSAGRSVADELEKFVQLRDSGALTSQEFEALKARLLA